jgi:L-amino acid N-acyltransferase YncA
MRRRAIGRRLYERFFFVVRALGCNQVHCVTSPINTDSIAFHRRLGFELLPGTGHAEGVPVTLDYAGPGQHRVRFRRSLDALPAP